MRADCCEGLYFSISFNLPASNRWYSCTLPGEERIKIHCISSVFKSFKIRGRRSRFNISLPGNPSKLEVFVLKKHPVAVDNLSKVLKDDTLIVERKLNI